MKSLSALSLLALALAACGSPSTPDAASRDATSDRAITSDSSAQPDAASQPDASAQPDGSSTMDVVTPMDVASQPDATTSPDVASQPDTASSPDVVNPRDTGVGGCTSNRDCPGQACLGIASCGGTGTCGGPTPCSRVVDPVCGCDGVTYTNECIANNAGVGVRSRGECATDAGVPDASAGACRSNADCTGRQVCRGIAACGATGMCATTSPCPLVFNPVCGCDGVTYGNTCELSNAGIGFLSMGACPSRTDAGADSGSGSCRVGPGCCATDADCGRGYCAPAQTCTGGVATSVCKTRPADLSECWRDSDCPAVGGREGVCRGATICPCGAACLVADAPGTCR